MAYKLLAVDLDGTLLNGKEKISAGNLAAVREAHRKGVKIVVSTGRSYTTAEEYIHQLDVGHLSVTYNGALIRNGTGIMRRVSMADNVAAQILRLLVSLGHCPIVYASDENKYYEKVDRYSEAFISYVGGAEMKMYKVDGLLERAWEDVLRLTVVTGTEHVERLHKEMVPRYASRIRTIGTYFPGFDFWTFEILDIGSSKSKGLEYICSRFGIGRGEVIAVGDNDNDVDMIEWAGLGAAMKNGLPAAREAADYVTERTNNEDGVAEVIERFVLS